MAKDYNGFRNPKMQEALDNFNESCRRLCDVIGRLAEKAPAHVEPSQEEKCCYNCGQPKDYKGRCVFGCDNYNGWIPKEKFTGTHEERTKTHTCDDEERCCNCIFDVMELVDIPCTRCKFGRESAIKSYFVPKLCEHEWKKSPQRINVGVGTDLKELYYCTKCGILRIEV